MKLSTLKKTQKVFHALNQNVWRMENKCTACPAVVATLIAGSFISSICFAEPLRTAFVHDPGQSSDVIFVDQIPGALAGFSPFNHEGKVNSERIGYGIELFALVSEFSQPMTEPSAQSEGDYRPDKSNKGYKSRVSVTESPKLSGEGAHGGWIFLLTQVATFLIMFPLGMYFSLRHALHRELRVKHTQGTHKIKVPVLSLISILCIPRRMKFWRWQVWEQRQLFRDIKSQDGFELAYRDARFWKMSVIKRWY